MQNGCLVLKRAAEIMGIKQLDLLVEPTPATEGLEVGLGARDSAAAQDGGLLAQLVPLARELAEQSGGRGVTVSDVVVAAARRGITVPDRAHCLGALMERAGLNATERMRRSPIRKHHGRLQKVWVYGIASTA